jgi:predicted porin
MKKKLIVLALATIAPAVWAQPVTSPVTLYGTINMVFDSVKADGGVTPLASRSRVSDQQSNFGIKGTEPLGIGLNAFFQIESAITPDVGTGTLGSRNSAVGLNGEWGTVLLGRWDTAYRVATKPLDPFNQNFLPGQSSVANDFGNFELRLNNAVQYWSPNFSGVSFRLHYSANEAKTSTVNPSVYSASLVYDKAPFYLGYAWEEHNNRTGSETVVTPNYKENSNGLLAKYTAGPVWFSLLVQDFKKTNLTKQKVVQVAANYTVGASQFKVSIGSSKDGAASGAAAPETKQWGLGWFYSLSKRTTLITAYANLKNNGASNRGNFGKNTLTPLGNDSDPTGLSIGLGHTF